MAPDFLARLWALVFLLSQVAPAAPAPRERITRLESTLLAPCCYSETLARHSSDVARKMRVEIAQWVGEGRSDREILDIYKARYGARVLAEPEGFVWWWSVTVPAAMVFMGTLATVWLIRRMRRPQQPSAAAPLPADADLPDLRDE